MKYKYEDTFVDEIEGYNNHRMATIYAMIVRRIAIVFIVCCIVYGVLTFLEHESIVSDECSRTLSINNCAVISTEK